jgi:hypothetical protein
VLQLTVREPDRLFGHRRLGAAFLAPAAAPRAALLRAHRHLRRAQPGGAGLAIPEYLERLSLPCVLAAVGRRRAAGCVYRHHGAALAPLALRL